MFCLSCAVPDSFILTSLSILCLAKRLESVEKMIGFSKYSLPDKFMLGVGSSAFQIEGAWNEGGRGESMWDTYVHTHPDFVSDHSNADVSADFYHKYKEDIQMIRGLGVNYFRLSISWPRLLPIGSKDHINKEGVKFYRDVFGNLIKANITPVVTLYHWDLPARFMDIGGWTNPKMVDYFEDYARIAFDLFGNMVKIWITINEPNQHCISGYGSDYHVPALNASGVADYICSHYLLLAHARAYHLYDKEYRRVQRGIIGVSLDSTWVEPKNNNEQQDIDAAERFTQIHFGLHAHPIFSQDGDYPRIVRERVDYMSRIQGYPYSRLPYFTTDEINSLKGSAYFLGLNHYTTHLASAGTEDKNWIIPSMEHDMNVWTERNLTWSAPGPTWLSAYPPGIRRHINWVTKEYGNNLPIIITENGLSDCGQLNDYERIMYFNNYINQILLAIYEDGCNVQGYFAWTLMDDFEWGTGYTYKFGLYHVDFHSPKKTRTAKLSVFNFREIARSRRINFDFIKPPSYL